MRSPSVSGEVAVVPDGALSLGAILEPLIAESADGVIVLDESWTVVYANAAAAEASGRRREALIGRPIREWYPTIDQMPFGMLLRRVAATRMSEAVEGMQAPSGRIYDVHVVPVPGGLSVQSRDVTARVRAEESTRDSEARFRLVTESAPVGVFLTDGRGHLVYANPFLREILGRSDSELAGHDWFHWVHRDDAARVASDWDGFRMAEVRSLDQQYRFARSTGEVRWVRSQIHRLRMPGSAPPGFVGTVEDVTLRRAAAERQRLLAATIEASEDFVALADDTMRVIHINPAGLSLIGLNGPGMALHRPVGDFVIAGDFARVGEEMMASLAATDHWAGELRLRHWNSDREILTEAHTFAVREMPGGPRTAFAMVARDIRERRRAEEVVRRHEARLAGIIGSANDAIISVDSGNRIVVFNQAAERMFRSSAAEATGTSLEQFLPATVGSPLTARRADGSEFLAEVTVSRVAVDNEQIGTVIVRDMTERNEIEEQLRQASKMEAVGQLAGGMAHDFNNLLTVITAYTGLLQESVGGSTIASELNEIAGAARRAATLTRQLLAFSRKQLLQPKVLNINNVVTELEPMLRRLIGEDIELSTVLAPALGYLRADPGQVEQVLVNLAVNAREAMPLGGVMQIVTTMVRLTANDDVPHATVPAGAYVRVEVRDNGVGMDEPTRAHVFEPFFTTKETGGRGTGLGLATVYGIVQQSGGHIWVDSAPGRGSAFVLLFPEVSDVGALVEAPVATTGRVGGSETVLVAEDDPAVRELIRALLTSNGYTVLDASNGAEALKVALDVERPIDLLVTDVVMPALGGRALVERLRETQPSLRVLYATGYVGDEVVRRGGLDPSAALLHKPFTADQLATAVRQALDVF